MNSLRLGIFVVLCASLIVCTGGCTDTQRTHSDRSTRTAVLNIVEREAWGWQDDAANVAEHHIEKITIHDGGTKFEDDRDPEQYPGDTNTSYDPTGHALIQIVGNYEERELTGEQLTAVIELSAMLAREYQVPVSDIRGHRGGIGHNIRTLLGSRKAATDRRNFFRAQVIFRPPRQWVSRLRRRKISGHWRSC